MGNRLGWDCGVEECGVEQRCADGALKDGLWPGTGVDRRLGCCHPRAVDCRLRTGRRRSGRIIPQVHREMSMGPRIQQTKECPSGGTYKVQ